MKAGGILSLLECKVEDVFKITGRGYILTLNLNDSDIVLKIGELLRIRDNEKQEIIINGIEMLNYGSSIKQKRDDIVGILVDISDEQATDIKGKLLIK